MFLTLCKVSRWQSDSNTGTDLLASWAFKPFKSHYKIKISLLLDGDQNISILSLDFHIFSCRSGSREAVEVPAGHRQCSQCRL